MHWYGAHRLKIASKFGALNSMNRDNTTVAQRGHEKYFSIACPRNRLLRAHAIATACARNSYCVRTQYLLREHAVPTA